MMAGRQSCPVEKQVAAFRKSGAKIFVYAGAWALSATKPMDQVNKVFLLLFVHKKKPSFPRSDHLALMRFAMASNFPAFAISLLL
jgi:hypothetical protein